MRTHFARLICGLGLSTLALLSGCQQTEPRGSAAPPPDARRPEIKSEEELAAQREARIQAGQVTPTSAPVLLGETRIAERANTPPPPPSPGPGAIAADILMVDSQVLTVAEVLYALRDDLAEIRQTQTESGFRERVRQLLRRETQREIGTILIYREADGSLEENQKTLVDKQVEKELENLAANDFGGSMTRLVAHLREWGLTKEQFHEKVKRDLLVRQYTREKLTPQIQLRRDELLAYYERNIAHYQTPETRELLLIEVPFEKLLPPGETWEGAARSTRAAAKLAAVERVRAAHAALAERPFGEVVKEFSFGAHVEEGGSWGMIGRPLQAPLDAVSAKVFELDSGKYTEPMETEQGWYIAGCGRIEPATQRSFAEAQAEIRKELMERKFQRLSADYVVKLASKATISSLDLFLVAAVKKAEEYAARPVVDEGKP